jgi:hypothetical protein
MKKHLVGKVKGSPMKVHGTGKALSSEGKKMAAPKHSSSSKPRHLAGPQKQAEGYTPKTSMPTHKRAGGKVAMARDKRLMKQAV